MNEPSALTSSTYPHDAVVVMPSPTEPDRKNEDRVQSAQSPQKGHGSLDPVQKSLHRKAVRFLFEYSAFLVLGAIAALVWANLDVESYKHFTHFQLSSLFVPASEGDLDALGTGGHQPSGHSQVASADEHVEGESHAHPIDIAFLVNDVLMALFFAIAAKEVWEALLPGGPLSNPRRAATPLLATAGGVVGPALLYLGGAAVLGQLDQLGRGWAVPCATDIAFSYLVARLIFGNGHPAIAFLLLLAIADDAASLVILAVFYPSGTLNLFWLLLTVAAVGIGYLFRRMQLVSFWWYLLIPGSLSWLSFYYAGIHPALGLVPIIPTLPHAHTDLGIFARDELGRHDTLNEFEHWWKRPVEIILGLFGLVNAGVVLSNFGAGTWLVMVGLLVGKPLGITLFTLVGEKLFRLEIPGGMSYRHIVSLGMVAGIGFTVALFVSTAAFTEPGPIQDSVKMGALGSFAAAILAYVGARAMGVRPQPVTV